MIRVVNLGKKFRDGTKDRWVLQDVSFEVNTGQTVAIAGPSGCGKTTLLSIMAGLFIADSGSVYVEVDNQTTQDLSSLTTKQRTHYRRSDTGFVYQFFNLLPTLTLTENVLLPLDLTGRHHLKDDALARIKALGLESRRNAFPDELSGGEQQRAAIARALAHNPSLVFADEPTGNLDSANAENVIDLLLHEVSQAGTTLVIATHSDNILSRTQEVVSL